MPSKLTLPRMGEAVHEATISLWIKKEGDVVEQGETLLEVNTDKVDSEVPSPVSGTLLRITAAEGDVVPVDGTLAWIGEPGEEIPEDEPVKPSVEKKTQLQEKQEKPKNIRVTPVAANAATAKNVPLSRVKGSGRRGTIRKQDVLNFKSGAVSRSIPDGSGYGFFISPVVARLAAEFDIDLADVTGTGLDGRITKRDVLAYIEEHSREPEIDYNPDHLVRISPVRKTIAERMVASKRISPHVASFMEIDMSAVIAHRNANKQAFAEKDLRLTFTAYIAFAAARALKANPMVNASWHKDGIILHPKINIGMATSLGDQGLIVPVIKDAADMSLEDFSFSVTDLAERARNKKLKADEVQSGTFSITNHGTSGSLFAMPIINQPQTAILSIGAIQRRAVVVDDEIVIRPMMYVGLTFDHRILDGEAADIFLNTFKDQLEKWN